MVVPKLTVTGYEGNTKTGIDDSLRMILKSKLCVLSRVTAQRSQEDAEEVERERRRRSREKERGERSPSSPESPLQDEPAYSAELVLVLIAVALQSPLL